MSKLDRLKPFLEELVEGTVRNVLWQYQDDGALVEIKIIFSLPVYLTNKKELTNG